jgi:sugar/nucleoside kinase (ribokinase family)
LRTKIVVTEAEKGAKIILPRSNGTQAYRQVGTTAIVPEDVSDSVGCGDFFAMATAIAYWRNGRNIDAAVAEGNRVAGEKLAGSFAVNK